jgi:hypothetical protein
MVAVSHNQDSFVFTSHLGENPVARANVHNGIVDPPHFDFAGLTTLMSEADNDAAIQHDGTGIIGTLDHAMALTAHHGLLV